MEDEKIIELYWLRNEDAITKSNQKYGNYCNSIALRILDNIEYSDECINDTWLRAWYAMPPQKPTVLRIFFGAITRNLALNKVRDLSREKRGGGQVILALDELLDCVPDKSSPEKAMEDREITDSLNRWLEKLDSEKRVAFIRRYWHCDSLTNVASYMGWSESKTNSLLRRLRLSLKQHLELEGIVL